MLNWIAWPWPLTSSNNIVHVNGSQSVRCLRSGSNYSPDRLPHISFRTEKLKMCQTAIEREDENEESTEHRRDCKLLFGLVTRWVFINATSGFDWARCQRAGRTVHNIYTSKSCFHFHGNSHFYFVRSTFQNAFVILIHLQVLSDECEWV